MNPFKHIIAEWMLQALQEVYNASEWTCSTLEHLIEQPPDPELGDYAFPCFSFARVLRNAPVRIAQALAESLNSAVENSDAFIRVKAVGPYLNFHVSMPFMAQITLPRIADGSYFKEAQKTVRERVMVEYSQPNTHKGFHVGHIRNVVLGNSLCKIFKYNGFDVLGVNYIGDVGTHIAKCLWYYLNENETPVPTENRGEWLGSLYTASIQKLSNLEGEDAEKAQKQVSELLRLLESKDPETLQIWNETRQWSLDAFDEIYEWLGVHFDTVFYESEVDEEGKAVVLQGLEEGVFQRSEGAIGIDLEEAGLGFFLLLKSDGNTLYSTKDIALAQKKFKDYKIDRSVYVVGSEQILHFKQVFETLKRMGLAQADSCFHLPYALVSLPSGKMSSRAGNVILFSEMREAMRSYIYSNYFEDGHEDWSQDEIECTAHKIAVAAIKYGMLSQAPNKGIVFLMEDWLTSEGDTGSYLIYAYVRIRSICRKINENPESLAKTNLNFDLLAHANEQALIRRLFDFNQVVWNAGEQYKTSLLARNLYELARDFSRAYSTCSVKHAESPELQSVRLLLFHCVAESLAQGLDLLGITPPERM